MKTKLSLALAAILAGTAFGSMPKVLPEFKNEKQLAEWRAEMAAKAESETSTSDVRSSTLDVPSAFYTGKPYVESSGGYAFKYRSYNPELARWTSEDPSGFPDGANGNSYAPIPTIEFDWIGMMRSGGAALWGKYYNYSDHEGPADVWAHVGGWMYDEFLKPNPDYYNSCALRLSIGLNDSGQSIASGIVSSEVCNGKNYIIRAGSMLEYLNSQWGSCDESLYSTDQISDLQQRLKTNHQYAVVASGSHIGMITGDYKDKYTPSGTMNVWILE